MVFETRKRQHGIRSVAGTAGNPKSSHRYLEADRSHHSFSLTEFDLGKEVWLPKFGDSAAKEMLVGVNASAVEPPSARPQRGSGQSQPAL